MTKQYCDKCGLEVVPDLNLINYSYLTQLTTNRRQQREMNYVPTEPIGEFCVGCLELIKTFTKTKP